MGTSNQSHANREGQFNVRKLEEVESDGDEAEEQGKVHVLPPADQGNLTGSGSRKHNIISTSCASQKRTLTSIFWATRRD